jgi:ribosomal protein S4E
LAGKKIQLNLSSGKNIISNEKIETGNFVLIKDNKISKVIELQKGIEVLVVSGKHTGKSGKIVSITKIGEDKIAELSTKEGELKLNITTLFALN